MNNAVQGQIDTLRDSVDMRVPFAEGMNVGFSNSSATGTVFLLFVTCRNSNSALNGHVLAFAVTESGIRLVDATDGNHVVWRLGDA